MKIKTQNILWLFFLVVFIFTGSLTLTKQASATFAPSDISGLKLWLDASQGVTSDGSTPAIDGDTVQQWNDQSTSSANATQATSGSRPTYKTGIINSKPVIRFGGAQNMNTSSFLDSSFDTNFTFFIMTTATSAATDEVTTSSPGWSWYSRKQGVFFDFNNIGSIIPSGPFLSALIGNELVTNPTIETFRYNGVNRTIHLNGVNSVPLSATTGNLGLSGALTIGSLPGNSYYYNGDIAEIITYNSALSDSDISQVESYLGTKYGVTLNDLPSTSNPLFVFDGDSMTYGFGADTGYDYPSQVQGLLGLTGTYQNLGKPSNTVANFLSRAPTQIDPEYSASRTTNIVTLMGGTNDLVLGQTATQTYNSIVSYCEARKTAGFKVIVSTILPRSSSNIPLSFETDRQTINSLIRANWHTFADGISDIASDSRIGDVGDSDDTTYYPDKVHMTNTGYGVVATYVTTAIKQIMNPIAVSDVSSTPSLTGASITWTTNQLGSTKVNYGLTSSYNLSTTEIDIATRVLSHSDSLSGLNACTTYHYQTVSNDLNGNQAVSDDGTFKTTGCIVATAIAGVTPPVTGATAVTEITSGTGYTGTVAWSPALVGGKFGPNKIYTATITLSPATNYTLTGITENQFTIDGTTGTAANSADSGIITAIFPTTAKTQLTISSPTPTTSKIYDGNNTAVVTAGTLSGVYGSEVVSIDTTTATYDTSAVGTGKDIIVVYTITGTNAGNYIKPVNYTTGTGEITQKQLTISDPTLTVSKQYDGTTTAQVTAGTLSGIVGSEDVSINTTTATYDTGDVGTGKTITVVYSITGTNSGNYLAPVNYTTTDGVITAIPAVHHSSGSIPLYVLQSMNDKLRAEQNAKTSITPTPIISSSLFNKLITSKTLRPGITNINVKTLQQFLNSKGFTVSITGAGSKGHETNYFGKLTKQAVIKFQKANKLTPDGIVGLKTRAKIKLLGL